MVAAPVDELGPQQLKLTTDDDVCRGDARPDGLGAYDAAPQTGAFPVGHSIRSGVAVGLPFVVGAATDHILQGMWVGLASCCWPPVSGRALIG